MPSAGSLAGPQELVCKIEQQIDSVSRQDRESPIRAANQEPSLVMINSSITKIEMCADVAATIVDGEEEPAGQVGELRLSAKPGIQLDYQRPHIDAPPLMPVSGDATMFRMRSCVSDGRNPAARTARIKPSGRGSGRPRSCRLAREVSWRSPLPNSPAIRLSRPSAVPVVCPPGIRTRTTAPSCARWGRSTPGQRSARVTPAIVSDHIPQAVAP